jgi:hypothetical protein
MVHARVKVTLLKLTGKAQPSVNGFSQTHKCPTDLCADFLLLNFTQIGI